MSQNFSHQDSSQEETNDGGSYYTPSRMHDLLEKTIRKKTATATTQNCRQKDS